MDKPFLCEKCRNWYIEVPVRDLKGNVLPKDEYGCRMCNEGTHVPNKAGIVDCHWGQVTPTPSEVTMAKIALAVTMAKNGTEKAIAGVGKLTMKAEADASLETCESFFEVAQRGVQTQADAMKFAGAFALPGIPKSLPVKDRYKTVDQMEQMVADNRRPSEDLDELNRSVKVCGELAIEIERDMGKTKVLIQQLREKAMNFKERQVPVGAK